MGFSDLNKPLSGKTALSTVSALFLAAAVWTCSVQDDTSRQTCRPDGDGGLRITENDGAGNERDIIRSKPGSGRIVLNEAHTTCYKAGMVDQPVKYDPTRSARPNLR